MPVIRRWTGSAWEDVVTTTIGPHDHAYDLTDLQDVTVTSPVTGNVIRWDGSAWRNAVLAVGDVSGLASDLAARVLDTDPRLSDARTPLAHSHAIADLPVAASGTSNATQLVRADDSRLSNSRAPSGAAGGDLAGTYPNPTVGQMTIPDTRGVDDLPQAFSRAAKWAFKSNSTIGLSGAYSGVLYIRSYTDTSAGRTHQIAYSDDGSIYHRVATTPLSNNTWGSWVKIADVSNANIFDGDPRLTDARTPTAHVHAAADITSGVLATARLGSGTANSSSWLRGDGVWAALPVGTLAGLSDTTITSPTSGQVLRYNGTAWVNAVLAQSDITGLVAALAGKEPTIAAGTTAQYWRGDKTWQTLDKAAVGLGNVDNTSDANKPISTAVQTALNGKANASHTHGVADLTATGTKDATTFLRGDNTWATPPGGGAVTVPTQDADPGTGDGTLWYDTDDETATEVFTAEVMGDPPSALTPLGYKAPQGSSASATQDFDPDSSYTGDPVDVGDFIFMEWHSASATNTRIPDPTGWTVLVPLAANGAGTMSWGLWVRRRAASDGVYSIAFTNTGGNSVAGRLFWVRGDGADPSTWVVGTLGTRAASGGTTAVNAPAITAPTGSRVALFAGERTVATETQGQISVAGSFTIDMFRNDGASDGTFVVASKIAEGSVGPITITYPNTHATNGLALLVAIPPRPVEQRLDQMQAEIDNRAWSTHTHTLESLSNVDSAAPSAGDHFVFESGSWKHRPLTATDVGAAPASHTHTKAQITDFAHTHPIADISATGTKDSTTFLRGDGTWAVPPSGSSYSLPSQAEAEAGTATTERVWSAQRVSQAINALSPKRIINVKAKIDHNSSLSGIPSTSDGVSFSAGDRILLTLNGNLGGGGGNGFDYQNGVWAVASGAWTRVPEADTAAELAGLLVFVEQGDAHGGTLWASDFKASDTLGTSGVRFSRVGAMVDYAGSLTMPHPLGGGHTIWDNDRKTLRTWDGFAWKDPSTGADFLGKVTANSGSSLQISIPNDYSTILLRGAVRPSGAGSTTYTLWPSGGLSSSGAAWNHMNHGGGTTIAGGSGTGQWQIANTTYDDVHYTFEAMVTGLGSAGIGLSGRGSLFNPSAGTSELFSNLFSGSTSNTQNIADIADLVLTCSQTIQSAYLMAWGIA